MAKLHPVRLQGCIRIRNRNNRKRQSNAAVRLVRWLQGRYGIATRDVIGHSMANDSRYFKDLQGWRNDHSDWLKRDVREFRRRLERR